MESNLAGINWVAVSEVFLASLFSLLVAFVLLFVREWYLGWSHRGRDKHLDELAALRAQAIGTRNDGEIGPLTGQALTDWLSEAHAAEDGMIAKAYEVGKIDGHLLDSQDRVQRLAYANITQANNPDQLTMLQNLSGAIIRAEVLLSKYRG